MADLRIAVTGLKGSGKTVFLTSLISNLIRGTAASFRTFGRRGVVFHAEPLPLPPTASGFPYHEFVRSLRSDSPEWPRSTVDVSEFRVALELRKKRHRRVVLHLVDYPGERLLDMPLLGLSYAEWSDRVTEEARHAPRQGMSAAWLAACDALEPHAGASLPSAQRAVSAYRGFLAACREQGLLYVQPSAMVLPTEASGFLDMAFCPLPREVRQRSPLLDAAFAQRYDSYREQYVRPFVAEVASCARQIVLVDVLRILRTGLHCFGDTQRCIEEVLKAFAYARAYPAYDPRHWWQQTVSTWLPMRRIDRVAFVATKADLATRNNRPRLRRLLEELVRFAANRLRFRMPDDRISFDYCAALRSTEDAAKVVDGMPLGVLAGRRRFDGHEVRQGVWFPGEVPEEWPTESYDPGEAGLKFPQFQPRSLPLERDDVPIPHLNLDEVFYAALGGMLR